MRQINKVDQRVHLSFADVLLCPYEDDFCTIESRNIPDLSSSVCTGVALKVPIITAPMDSVTTAEMAIAMHKCGGLGIHTRFINQDDELEKQIVGVKQIASTGALAACAVGVKGSPHKSVYDHVQVLCDFGLKIVCLDIANGSHIFMARAIESIIKLKDKYGINIIAGNVATGISARRLANCGAGAIKIGIGGGAICVTRRVTGFGVPQFTAILECVDALTGLDVCVIADGGIRNSGDMVKALWAGADCVMSGFLFSGHDECPNFNGQKQYRGMASRTVSRRDDVAPEGVCINVEEKGPVENTMRELASALRAGLSMGNARNLKELRENVRCIRVSTMSNDESDPIKII